MRLGIAALLLVSALGCSSGSSDGPSTATPSGGAGGSAGTAGAAGGSSGGTGGAAGTATCGSLTSDTDPCATCVKSKCDAELKTAYGAGYASGDFTGGACSDFAKCLDACGTDCTCQNDCSIAPTGTCLSAAQDLQTCAMTKCPECG